MSPPAAGSLLPSLPSGARILIIRLRSIGDIVLLTPALRLLKEWRPDLHVSVMVEDRFRELLENNPHVDAILEMSKASGLAQLGARLGTIRRIRRGDFQLCMNLHGGPTSASIASWSGARWKAAFGHFRRKGIYDYLIPDPRTILKKETIHTAEHQASAFFHLGLPSKEIPAAQIQLTAAEHAWWARKRESLGVPATKPYVVIHPMALYATKQWSPGNFAALGASLDSRFSVIYACGPGESRVLDEVEKAAGKKVSRLEGAGLRHFAATLAGARLFIGNDSGPAHMAAAVGIPGVVIFSSSSSTIWAPWRPRAAWRIVQNHFDCNPCPGDRCYQFERPECILSITFNQVRSAVEAVLSEAKALMDC
ncbi:MAG: glycosyltransferase family 9 protein [Acidobacteria bacterium]|nr:glycosyltransferase family 9 protein [Acidobacteriota bacterium]